jgi:hypothetical protein
MLRSRWVVRTKLERAERGAKLGEATSSPRVFTCRDAIQSNTEKKGTWSVHQERKSDASHLQPPELIHLIIPSRWVPGLSQYQWMLFGIGVDDHKNNSQNVASPRAGPPKATTISFLSFEALLHDLTGTGFVNVSGKSWLE